MPRIINVDPYQSYEDRWIRVLSWQANCKVKDKDGNVVGDSSLSNSIEIWIPPFGLLESHVQAVIALD